MIKNSLSLREGIAAVRDQISDCDGVTAFGVCHYFTLRNYMRHAMRWLVVCTPARMQLLYFKPAKVGSLRADYKPYLVPMPPMAYLFDAIGHTCDDEIGGALSAVYPIVNNYITPLLLLPNHGCFGSRDDMTMLPRTLIHHRLADIIQAFWSQGFNLDSGGEMVNGPLYKHLLGQRDYLTPEKYFEEWEDVSLTEIEEILAASELNRSPMFSETIDECIAHSYEECELWLASS